MSNRAQEPGLVSSPSGRSRRALLVDPDDAFRRKAARALLSLGHRVVAVRDQREALRSLTQHIPDLIVVDLNLPDRGGEELYRAIRGDQETLHVPFLFLGRGGHPLEISRGISLDGTAILKKPFTRARFVERVLPLLNRLDRIDDFGQAGAFAGTLGELDLYDLLGLLERYRRTGTLTLISPEVGPPAIAVFVGGRLVQASYGALEGRDVLMELMLWPDGRFQFQSHFGPVSEVEFLIAEDVWLELAEFLHLVDRGRLNPFPMTRTRAGSSEGATGREAPGRRGAGYRNGPRGIGRDDELAEMLEEPVIHDDVSVIFLDDPVLQDLTDDELLYDEEAELGGGAIVHDDVSELGVGTIVHDDVSDLSAGSIIHDDVSDLSAGSIIHDDVSELSAGAIIHDDVSELSAGAIIHDDVSELTAGAIVHDDVSELSAGATVQEGVSELGGGPIYFEDLSEPGTPDVIHSETSISQVGPLIHEDVSLIVLGDDLVEEPPPPRDEPEPTASSPGLSWARVVEPDPDLEHLLSDSWASLVTDPSLLRTAQPMHLDDFVYAKHAHEHVETRAEVVARLLHLRGQRLEPGVEDLLYQSQERLQGVLQLGTRDGDVLASTVSDVRFRQKLARMTQIMLGVAADGERNKNGTVEHLVVEYERGHLMLMGVRDDLYLTCYAPLETRLGSLIVECQRLVERLLRPLTPMSPS